jgi:hypothetical protein
MASLKDNKNKTKSTTQRLAVMEKLLLDSVKQGKLGRVKKILDEGASVNTTDKVR